MRRKPLLPLKALSAAPDLANYWAMHAGGMTAERPATIRSYVLRQGRITQAQRRAWQQHAGRYIVSLASPLAAADWAAVFNRQAPLVVEIGSGYGEATAAMAAASPHCNYIAFEVHSPGVGALMKRLADDKIENVRIVYADALRTLPSLFVASSVAAFNIFFPDPWHKKKHHKRRLINPQTVALLLEKLSSGGGVHFVTDFQPYAEQAAPLFAAVLAAAPPPARASTGYERRAAAARRALHELYFVKPAMPGG